MQQSRLVPAALFLGCSLMMTASIAFACTDKAKTTATTASTRGKVDAVTVSSTSCSAEQMASCAKGAKTSATSASMSGDACCMGKAKGASSTTATVAPVGKVNAMAVGTDGGIKYSGNGCGWAKGNTASAASSCGASKNTAMAAGSSCSAHGLTGTAKAGGHDCEACNDFAMCEGEVKANGVNVQIVPLKNGVMYVYTANGAAKVQAVQSAMARRNQHMTAILASGDQASLCPECKSMRGAIASGKLNRENVNIEGGCMTLVTSSDPTMVSKIYSLAGLKANGRNKS